MVESDFIEVRLSAAGVKFAGDGGVVRVNASRRDFAFEAGKPQRVLKAYEWSHILAPMQCNGEPIFEIVTEAPAAEAANGQHK